MALLPTRSKSRLLFDNNVKEKWDNFALKKRRLPQFLSSFAFVVVMMVVGPRDKMTSITITTTTTTTLIAYFGALIVWFCRGEGGGKCERERKKIEITCF